MTREALTKEAFLKWSSVYLGNSLCLNHVYTFTPCNSYLGGHVVKTLLARGYSVRGTVRSTSKLDKITHLQVKNYGLLQVGMFNVLRL